MKITYQGTLVDLAPPWKVLTMDQALVEVAGIDPGVLADDVKVMALAKEKGIKLEEKAGPGKAKTELFELLVEEKLINPEIKSNEDDLNFVPKLDHDFTSLAGEVGSADAKPTDSEEKYYLVLKKELDGVLAEFQDAVDHDLADFNRTVEQEKLAPVMVLPKVGEES